MNDAQPPPEALVIDRAQKSAVPAISMREAARRADISDGRWRQIVKGYQAFGGGRIPVNAPDETIARMAYAVEVTPEQLAEAGRPGAAEVLRRIREHKNAPHNALSEISTDDLLAEIRRRTRDPRLAPTDRAGHSIGEESQDPGTEDPA